MSRGGSEGREKKRAMRRGGNEAKLKITPAQQTPWML
jgi:hypothetical protein